MVRCLLPFLFACSAVLSPLLSSPRLTVFCTGLVHRMGGKHEEEEEACFLEDLIFQQYDPDAQRRIKRVKTD